MGHDDADFHAFHALQVRPVDLTVRVFDVVVDRIVLRFVVRLADSVVSLILF